MVGKQREKPRSAIGAEAQRKNTSGDRTGCKGELSSRWEHLQRGLVLLQQTGLLGVVPLITVELFLAVFSIFFSRFFFFFPMRKIDPELTSVANLPPFCMWDAATACVLHSDV